MPMLCFACKFGLPITSGLSRNKPLEKKFSVVSALSRVVPNNGSDYCGNCILGIEGENGCGGRCIVIFVKNSPGLS